MDDNHERSAPPHWCYHENYRRRVYYFVTNAELPVSVYSDEFAMKQGELLKW